MEKLILFDCDKRNVSKGEIVRLFWSFEGEGILAYSNIEKKIYNHDWTDILVSDTTEFKLYLLDENGAKIEYENIKVIVSKENDFGLPYDSKFYYIVRNLQRKGLPFPRLSDYDFVDKYMSLHDIDIVYKTERAVSSVNSGLYITLDILSKDTLVSISSIYSKFKKFKYKIYALKIYIPIKHYIRRIIEQLRK